ncbi:MAG: aminopeptidase N, partial [Corynebacterium sp.]|nr:aminopeptidase N [Corynebacterium sp.]
LVIRHLLAGFNAPGSGAVLAQALDDDSRATINAEQSATSLSEHFFAVANSWWKQFSSETAQTLLEGFYPTWEISDEAIAAAQRLLDSDETASPVKRIISEQQFLVKLALRAREFDAK